MRGETIHLQLCARSEYQRQRAAAWGSSSLLSANRETDKLALSTVPELEIASEITIDRQGLLSVPIPFIFPNPFRDLNLPLTRQTLPRYARTMPAEDGNPLMSRTNPRTVTGTYPDFTPPRLPSLHHVKRFSCGLAAFLLSCACFTNAVELGKKQLTGNQLPSAENV